MSEPLAVVVPRERIEACRARALAVARALGNKRNYDGATGRKFERYFPGFVGEEAFARLLELHRLPFHHEVHFDGERHPPDFRVAGLPIEVKALADPRAEAFVIGVKRDKRAAAYVSVRARGELDRGAFLVVGWLSRREVLELPISPRLRYGDRVFEEPLARLRPPGELLGLLRRRLARTP